MSHQRKYENDSFYKDKRPTENDDNLKCGYLGWRPQCLQRFNTPKFLLACICWSTLTQGFVVNGINYVNVSTFERRFDLSSKSVAWITSSYDVLAGILGVTLGYLGMFVHQGKVIAICCLFMSAGSFTMFLPHLLAGVYELGPKDVDVCDLSGNATNPCDSYDGGGSSYLGWLITGNMLHGIGGAAIYTLAIPYMDENIRSKDTAMYIGVMQAFACLGPAFGFVVGGYLLTIYVDAGRVDMGDIDITPDDPRWVGAWWISYLYSGFATLTVSLILFCFPKQLSTAKEIQDERWSQAYKGSGEDKTKNEEFGKSFSDLVVSIKILLLNPTYIFLTLGGVVESCAVIGFAVFLPKILQFQFSQSLLMSGVWAGVVVIPGAAGGQLLGGLIPSWLNLRLKGMVVQCMIMSLISIGLAFQFLLRCEIPGIGGISVPYLNSSLVVDDSNRDVFHPCNTACNCTTESYDPICGADDVQYFNPCLAGCQSVYDFDGEEVYNNCSCIASDDSLSNVPQATKGICEADCDVLPLFLVLFFFVNLSTFMSATTGQAATIRCVPDKERPFAMGLQSTIVRYAGQLPAPFLMAQIFDSSCWLWQETCGNRGACWIYDAQSIAVGITQFGAVLKGISFISFSFALFTYKPGPGETNDKNMDQDKDGKVNGGYKQHASDQDKPQNDSDKDFSAKNSVPHSTRPNSMDIYDSDVADFFQKTPTMDSENDDREIIDTKL